METYRIEGGMPYVHAYGHDAVTVTTDVMMDDGTDAGLAWVRPICEWPEVTGGPRRVVHNRPEGIRPWLRSTGNGAMADALSDDGARSLAIVVLWHEIGHAVLGSPVPDYWASHVEETWCDAFGCAAALALGGSPGGLVAANGMHGPPTMPGDREPFDLSRFLIGYCHDTMGVCLRVLARWEREPWDTSLASVLAVASEECAAVRPEPRADRTALEAAVTAAETRGGRCVRLVNDRFAKADLGLVHERGTAIEDLVHEMAVHMQAGRRVVEPRVDLPGGTVAAAALRLAEAMTAAVGAA